MLLYGIDLNNKTVILPAKMGLFRNSKEFAAWDKQAIGIAKAIVKFNKREECCFTKEKEFRVLVVSPG